MWIGLSEDVNIEKLNEAMKNEKVSVKLGDLFSINGKFKNYIRISFAYYEEKDIIEGVQRLINAVQNAMK